MNLSTWRCFSASLKTSHVSRQTQRSPAPSASMNVLFLSRVFNVLNQIVLSAPAHPHYPTQCTGEGKCMRTYFFDLTNTIYILERSQRFKVILFMLLFYLYVSDMCSILVHTLVWIACADYFYDETLHVINADETLHVINAAFNPAIRGVWYGDRSSRFWGTNCTTLVATCFLLREKEVCFDDGPRLRIANNASGVHMSTLAYLFAGFSTFTTLSDKS
jgi:hypothetical protein